MGLQLTHTDALLMTMAVMKIVTIKGVALTTHISKDQDSSDLEMMPELTHLRALEFELILWKEQQTFGQLTRQLLRI